MKSTIRIDFAPMDSRPVITIKSVSSSDDLRDKALVNFLAPIVNKQDRLKETYLRIARTSQFAGTNSECGDTWEISSFGRDNITLHKIEGMHSLLCVQSKQNIGMCNTGSQLYFENLETGKSSEKLNIDDLEFNDYHKLASTIEENFKSIIKKSK